MEATIIYLYTDGSVTAPKDGESAGGWAFTYSLNERRYSGSGGSRLTTNNRMEMVGVIKGFQSLLARGMEGSEVIIVSDSQIVINGASQWMYDWKRNNWRSSSGKLIKNYKYWEQLDMLASRFKTRWKWIKGHRGHPENELCDKMAKAAAKRALGMEDFFGKAEPKKEPRPSSFFDHP